MGGLVTVIGGTGFVGRHTARALARAGWRVRVASRHPHLAHHLRVAGDVGQIDLVRASVHAPDSLRQAVQGADAVVYLAGALFERGNQSFEALSHKGAVAVAQAAHAAGVQQFVLISAIGADADSPSVYARAKAAGEAGVRAAFPAAAILRPSLVFGPEDQFFNRFAAMAAMAPALPLIGGGQTRFQPVYVADVAAAIVAALARPDSHGQTYELGGPGVYSFRTLMQMIAQHAQRTPELIPLPTGLAKVMGAVAGGLCRLLPINPPLTLDQVRLLARDNVVADGAKGFGDLGLAPTSLEAILPAQLVRFRPRGQFSPA